MKKLQFHQKWIVKENEQENSTKQYLYTLDFKGIFIKIWLFLSTTHPSNIFVCAQHHVLTTQQATVHTVSICSLERFSSKEL